MLMPLRIAQGTAAGTPDEQGCPAEPGNYWNGYPSPNISPTNITLIGTASQAVTFTGGVEDISGYQPDFYDVIVNVKDDKAGLTFAWGAFSTTREVINAGTDEFGSIISIFSTGIVVSRPFTVTSTEGVTEPGAHTVTFSFGGGLGNGIIGNYWCSQSMVEQTGPPFILTMVVTYNPPASGPVVAVTPSIINRAPAADAGPDQWVNEGTRVTLYGSASDPDQGDALLCSWTQEGGPSVEFNRASCETSWDAAQVDVTTEFSFRLTVSDGVDDAVDSTKVWVQDVPDVPQDVPDVPQDVPIEEPDLPDLSTVSTSLRIEPREPREGEAVSFYGTIKNIGPGYASPSQARVRVDFAGGPEWEISPAKGAITLRETAALSSQETTELFWTIVGGTVPIGTHRFEVCADMPRDQVSELKENNNCRESMFTISASPVSSENRPPSADAGTDQIVNEGAEVTLSGSGSDPDGDQIVACVWSQADGPSVFVDFNTCKTIFNAPQVDRQVILTFSLRVKDSRGAWTPADRADLVEITIENISDELVVDELEDTDDPDDDDDGIPDTEDQCPTQAETVNGLEDSDGCADGPPESAISNPDDPDDDDDGIPDTEDQCPTQAETVNGLEDSDGCADGPPESAISNPDDPDDDDDDVLDLREVIDERDQPESEQIRCDEDMNPQNTFVGCVFEGTTFDRSRYRGIIQEKNILSPVESFIAFTENWGATEGPFGRIDDFSVMWFGAIDFTKGFYRFYTRSDDGSDLWVEPLGKIIGAGLPAEHDNWGSHHDQTKYSNWYELDGAASIITRFFENGGVAFMEMGWEKMPDVRVSCIPSPVTAFTDAPVQWIAFAEGGIDSYEFKWEGDEDLDGVMDNPKTVFYDTAGTKRGLVTVRSGPQSTAAISCDSSVRVVEAPPCIGECPTEPPDLDKDEPADDEAPDPADDSDDSDTDPFDPDDPFDADDEDVASGDEVTLRWETEQANSCTITDDNPAEADLDDVPLQCNPPECDNKDDTVRPVVTTTYTLTCSGPGGTVRARETIRVLKIPGFKEVAPR